MSCALLATPRSVFEFPPSEGHSADARTLGGLLTNVRDHLWATFSLGQSRNDAEIQLVNAYREASRPNWDAYEALPVSEETYGNASRFLGVFPANLPMPEISADPDGEISFEWYASPRKVFSISIGRASVLTYAGLFGRSKVQGTEVFDGRLPSFLPQYIARVMD